MTTSNSLNKKRWSVVGVSGGPDSMALLNMLKDKNKENLVVVHVNYHQRDTANRDEKIVSDYCLKHQIPFVVYEEFQYESGNFQHLARQYRLHSFKEVYDGYQASRLYLAHHHDDHLETILFQLLSKREPSTLGLNKTSKLMGMRVKRPLLKMTKDEILEYCQNHGLVYGTDETNLEPLYTRNILRQVLSEMSEEDKNLLLEYSNVYAKKSAAIERTSARFLKKQKDEISLEDYQNLSLDVRLEVLRQMFKQYGLNPYRMSKKHFISLDDKLHQETHQRLSISKNYWLVIEYGVLYLLRKESKDYKVTIDKLKNFKHPNFKLSLKGDGLGLKVTEDDFPLTIRNAHIDDVILMHYGTKKINRFFIDRKIKYKDRLTWPVIENAEGDIIFVSELGCDRNHYDIEYNLFLDRITS